MDAKFKGAPLGADACWGRHVAQQGSSLHPRRACAAAQQGWAGPHENASHVCALTCARPWPLPTPLPGEEALRRSGVDYCVVRPGGLTDGPAGQATLTAQQGDRASGRVSRADVAAVCVAALTDAAASRRTLELVDAKPTPGGAAPPPPPPLDQQLAGLFAGLSPDPPTSA